MWCETAKLTGWCGMCYANRRRRENNKGHAFYIAARKPARDREVGIVKKPARGGTDDMKQVPANESEFPLLFPSLWEHLTADKYEDGSKRTRSTLLVFVEDGVWKAMVNDRQEQRLLWVSTSEWRLLFQEVEAQLTDGETVWRKQKNYQQRK